MWVYSQARGNLHHDGIFVGTGYSGNGEGKNNPAMQEHPDLGPCPRGFFTTELITDERGNACDYEGKKAPVLRLLPDAETEMFGRSGMLMHGDSLSSPGTASRGCIIQNHKVRAEVAASTDKRLQVV